jgi:hypothetical protein
MNKRKPITDARAGPVRTGLQDLIERLVGTGKASLEAGLKLPEREALRHATAHLGPCTKSLIGIIEESGISPGMQKAALLSLWGALEDAFMIGSQGTVSENTKKYIKAVGTAAGRSKAAEKREPQLELMAKLIREGLPARSRPRDGCRQPRQSRNEKARL